MSQPFAESQLKGQSLQLRAELKQWERDFAAAHNGHKAGREDIKQHPDIASKYKIYDKLRQNLSQAYKATHQTPISPVPSNYKKRSSSSIEPIATHLSTLQTPSKRTKHVHPLHSHPANAFASRPLGPALLAPHDLLISSLLSPSKARTSIGPTPQKDGKFLGLFDVLTSGSADRTPSKRKILDPIAGNVQHTTPSKNGAGIHQKLPGSASKGQGLKTVFTPMSHRVNKANANRTPASRSADVRKLHFDDTPAFLRRDIQRPLPLFLKGGDGDEDGDAGDAESADGESWSPIAPRKLHRPVAGRGLSALVKGLRDVQDARLDEDLDLLREMEGGSTFESFASKMNDQSTRIPMPKILVGDSQVLNLPLKPDGAFESEEEMGKGEGKSRDGRPLKAWKKKGQKRTTRAVKMRPNVSKWKPEPVWKGGVEVELGGGEGVGERELGADPNVGDNHEYSAGATREGNDDNDSGADDDNEFAAHQDADAKEDANAESDDMAMKMSKWRKQKRDLKEAKMVESTKEGIVQKVKKKISATAHANFRALKIRNKNSKAKVGGRFGRRR